MPDPAEMPADRPATAPAPTRIPGSVRRAVIERDGRHCKLCGRPVVKRSGRRGRSKSPDNQLTLDHLVPISKGGGPTVENLRVCCRKCNMARSSRGAVDAAALRSEQDA